jgi:hypothetical protein
LTDEEWQSLRAQINNINMMFQIESKLKKKISLSRDHWKHISELKHPEVRDRK